MAESPSPRRSLRTNQRAFRERQILLATRRLLASGDCASITMEQIASSLATSKAAIYRHFDSRGELLTRALAASIAEVAERAWDRAGDAPTVDGLVALARGLAREWLGLVDASDGLPCCLHFASCPFGDWAPLIEIAGEVGAGTGLADPGQATGFVAVLRALCAVMLHRARAEGRPVEEEDVEVVLAYLFRGAAPDRSLPPDPSSP